MCYGRTHRCNNAFANARDDRFFSRTTNQAVDVRTDRYARFCTQLNAILCNRRDYRRFNHFGVHAHLHGIKHVTPGKIDCAGTLKVQRDACTLRSDERVYNAVYIAACEVMRFEFIERNYQAGFG